MKCPVCSGEMVKARATSFGEEYDYCRACKKELKEMHRPVPVHTATKDGWVHTVQAWSAQIKNNYAVPPSPIPVPVLRQWGATPATPPSQQQPASPPPSTPNGTTAGRLTVPAPKAPFQPGDSMTAIVSGLGITPGNIYLCHDCRSTGMGWEVQFVNDRGMHDVRDAGMFTRYRPPTPRPLDFHTDSYSVYDTAPCRAPLGTNKTRHNFVGRAGTCNCGEVFI